MPLLRPSSRLIWLMLLGCLVLPIGNGWCQSTSREDRIKVALIFKLVKFVEWSPSALPQASPLQFCAYGTSGVGDGLAAADGKPVRDRIARYRRLDGLSASEVRSCHVIFLPAWGRESSALVAQFLRARGSGTLTISDQADFARHGGMIGLIQRENKPGFEINLRATREGGMEPGAPLLELATIVD